MDKMISTYFIRYSAIHLNIRLITTNFISLGVHKMENSEEIMAKTVKQDKDRMNRVEKENTKKYF